MIRNAKALAPLVASVAAAVTAAAISVALLGAAPAQAQSTEAHQVNLARAVYLGPATQVHHHHCPQALLRANTMVQAWPFETEGHLALKTLAKPQRSA